MEQIEADIIEAAKLYPDKKRVYLLSGDPFVLSFDKLKQIGLWLNQYIPSLEAVAMFASINSIKQKTDAELKTLFGLKNESSVPRDRNRRSGNPGFCQ